MAQRAFSDFIGFSRASAAWRFNSSGVLVQDAANVARDDYDPVSGLWNGLLIEEARTNSLRNNSMTGAASGTPGTLPTNWTVNPAGTTLSVIGTGTEQGIPYVDLRLQGTPTGGTIQISVEAGTTVAAATGQAWSFSTFARVVGGSLTNVSSFRLNLDEGTSGGAYVFANTSAAFQPVGGSLAQGRLSFSPTLSGGATVATLGPQLRLNVTTGSPIDITLRIGAPQLELGAFPTSPILTTNAQVTRAADTVAVGNLSPWFNPSEGTLYVEGISATPSGSGALRILQLDDGSANNRITLARNNAQKAELATVAASVSQPSVASAAALDNVSVFRVAATYKANDFALSLNGAAPVTSASGAIPAVSTLRIGHAAGGTAYFSGWFRALKFNPRRMTNAELQAMTTLPNANGPTLSFNFKTNTLALEHI